MDDLERYLRRELDGVEEAGLAGHDQQLGERYHQAVRADRVDDLTRAANRDAADGMTTSGRMWRQARDEAAAAASEQAGDGSTWLPPGARPERPRGVQPAMLARPPGWKPWYRRLFGG